MNEQNNAVLNLLVALCDTVLTEDCESAPVLRLMSAFLGELDCEWGATLKQRVVFTLEHENQHEHMSYLRNELLMYLLEQSHKTKLETVDLSGNSVSLYHLQAEHELTELQMTRIKQVIYEN